MAAVAIPLIAGILPDVIKLIASLVHQHAPVAQTTNGDGTGPVKFAEVFAAVMKSLQAAAAAGRIPSAMPADEIIKAIIEAVVSSMKLSGLLGGDQPPVPVITGGGGPQAITIRPGQQLVITVAA